MLFDQDHEFSLIIFSYISFDDHLRLCSFFLKTAFLFICWDPFRQKSVWPSLTCHDLKFVILFLEGFVLCLLLYKHQFKIIYPLSSIKTFYYFRRIIAYCKNLFHYDHDQFLRMDAQLWSLTSWRWSCFDMSLLFGVKWVDCVFSHNMKNWPRSFISLDLQYCFFVSFIFKIFQYFHWVVQLYSLTNDFWVKLQIIYLIEISYVDFGH